MEATEQRGRIDVSMTQGEAQELLAELDKWPDLPQVERDLVEALRGTIGSGG